MGSTPLIQMIEFPDRNSFGQESKWLGVFSGINPGSAGKVTGILNPNRRIEERIRSTTASFLREFSRIQDEFVNGQFWIPIGAEAVRLHPYQFLISVVNRRIEKSFGFHRQ
jgi:hypothetical protein